jgi:hypothetical protein
MIGVCFYAPILKSLTVKVFVKLIAKLERPQPKAELLNGN